MHNDKMADAVDVPIKESSEKWSEFTLEDGTVLRMKLNLVSASRITGEFDMLGNPAYAMNITPTVAIVESPEKLRKRDS